jgi:hypothetical protein
VENIPTASVICSGFELVAKNESEKLGMPEIGWVLVEYPIAGLEPAELEAKAKLAYPRIVAILTKDRDYTKAKPQFDAPEGVKQTIRLTGDTVNEILEKLNVSFNKNCWSDGLPLVPPTVEAVNEMLSGLSFPPDHVVGLLYPNQAKATVEKIAINAVMAGCKPVYMPILVSAIKAITIREYNQERNLLSTGGLFPVVLVNGPIAKKANVNGAGNAFGPGWRANATIGRAVRLVIINIGGSWPGRNDMSALGHPAKYTCCIAENEESSPWVSLSEELGYPKGASTVTVMPGLFMGYCGTSGGPNPEDILQPLCDQLCSANSTSSIDPSAQTLVVLNPIHAKMLHNMGFNKQDVKQYIYENTRHSIEKYLRMVKLAAYSSEEIAKIHKNLSTWPGSTVSMHESPDKIRIIVAGAEGTQNLFIRGFHGDMVTCEVPT